MQRGLVNNVAQLEAIVKTLSYMCKLLVLDLGTGITEATKRVAPLCETATVVTEPSRVGILQTKALIADLADLGLSAARLDVVMVNRAPSSLQMSWPQAEEMLGSKITAIITPAAELAHQAQEAGTPMALLRPETLTADQFRQLTSQLLQKLRL
jgi:MinD-like ATPase involved in chromosome partitioning or flagellar assembly